MDTDPDFFKIPDFPHRADIPRTSPRRRSRAGDFGGRIADDRSSKFPGNVTQ